MTNREFEQEIAAYALERWLLSGEDEWLDVYEESREVIDLLDDILGRLHAAERKLELEKAA